MNRKLLRFRLIGYILILLPCISLGQSRYFRNYSVEHGLPFINVSAMYQDDKGYLWCGGYGGVSRFDGYSFHNYGPRDGLANNYVKCITQDRSGSIWLGTFKGLSRFYNNRFENFYTEDGLAGNDINRLFIDSRNILWVGTKEGLSYKREKDFKPVLSWDLKGKNITGITEDKYGTLFLSSDTTLYIAKFSDGNLLMSEYLFVPGEITFLYCDHSNNIWVGTKAGLYLYSQGKIISRQKNIDVKEITESPDKVVWIGTTTGLIKYENGQFESQKIRKDINSNLVSSLLIDREENLWIGSYSGLFMYRGDLFTTYSEQDGLKNTFIFQVVRDNAGNLWVTSGGGLYRYDGNEFRIFTRKDNLPSNSSLAIVKDKYGRLWIGTGNGLAVYDGSEFRSYTGKDGLRTDSIFSLLIDSRERLWIGGYGGVSVFDGRKFSFLPLGDDNKELAICAIIEDRKGDIWLGAYQGGLYRYSKGVFENMGARLKIRTGSFMALAEDKEGGIYIGTFDGVFTYDGHKVRNIGEKDGLNSDLVYTMGFEHDQSFLWIGTNQGLNRLDLFDFKKNNRIELQTFNKEEGFLGVECNSNGTYLDYDHSLWFSTVNGLIKYNPLPKTLNKIEPQTIITKIKLFDRDTLLQQNTKFEHWQNHISFDFVGISFTSPQKVKYKYMLKGFDRQWSEKTDLRTVSYSNLPPGSYKFMVLSCNSSGVWNIKPATYSFSILTPFWKTLWFRLSVLGMLVISAVFIVRFRIQQIKKKERSALQQKIHVMDYQLKALRAQMNPHFIFNSLNSIQNFIINSNEDAANKYLNKFAKLMRLILNNSESATVTVREELEALDLYLELERMRFEKKFDYKIEVDDAIDQDFYEIPSMLLQPYVENAIIHGLNPKKSKGSLIIKLETEENCLVCTVEDDGIGRKKAEELRQARSHHKSVGMKITQERLQMLNAVHNSSLSVAITDLVNEAGESAGTRVQIFIPLIK